MVLNDITARRCAKSLREACAELKTSLGDEVELWQWGKIHSLMLSYALGRIKLLRPLLNIGPFPSPGDGTTINTVSTGIQAPTPTPWVLRYGSSSMLVSGNSQVLSLRPANPAALFTPLRRSDGALARGALP